MSGPKLYLIEVIRYGSVELGVHYYGITDKFEAIAEEMYIYNNYRGGKYPEYFVTEFVLNDLDLKNRVQYRYNVYTGECIHSTAFDSSGNGIINKEK